MTTSYQEDMKNLTEAFENELSTLPRDLSERLKLLIARAILETVFPRRKSDLFSVTAFIENINRYKARLPLPERRVLSNITQRVMDKVVVNEFMLF